MLKKQYKNKKLIINQFQDLETKTLTYLVQYLSSSSAVIIDPVEKQVNFYLDFINKERLNLRATLDTHIHSDHISGSNKLASMLKDCKYFMGNSIIAKKITNNIVFEEKVLSIGNINIQAIYTPGHTIDSYCFLLENFLFSGDTILINGTGRTDLENGNSKSLYQSIYEKILNLDKNIVILPGHDYKGKLSSTLLIEIKNNPFLKASSENDFLKLKEKQVLPFPKNFKSAVERNKESLKDYINKYKNNIN